MLQELKQTAVQNQDVWMQRHVQERISLRPCLPQELIERLDQNR